MSRALIVSVLVMSGAQAGELKSVYKHAVAEDYFDWSYAQHVWADLNDGSKFDGEWAKYSAEFEPWLDRYKKNARAAMNELEKMPKDRRLKIQRGYDMQLAFDQWFDHVYSWWYKYYPYEIGPANARGEKAETFDDWLNAPKRRNACIQERMLDECGPFPDWRSPKRKEREQAMMAKAQAEYEAEQAKKKTK